MDAFVVLSLALAAASVGLAFVGALGVARALRGLRAVVGNTMEQLQPLRTELADELAVTSIEVDAVGRRLAALQAPHLTPPPPAGHAGREDVGRPGSGGTGSQHVH